MRRPHMIFSTLVLAAILASFLFGSPAFAQKGPVPPAAKAAAQTRAAMGGEADRGTQTRAAAASKNGKTQVIVDQKTNTVHILINGKEVVTIDAKGLHVKGNVDYTGIITDKG
jgi:hypothetical protein